MKMKLEKDNEMKLENTCIHPSMYHASKTAGADAGPFCNNVVNVASSETPTASHHTRTCGI